MKHLRYLSLVISCCSIICFSGCCRYINWLRDAFYQGQPLNPQVKAAQQYLRTVHVYNELSTAAHFDALWISNEVRHLYSSVYAARCGLNQEQFKTFCRRQMAENQHFITFYVLTAIERSCFSHIPLLTDKDSEWCVYLKIGCNTYKPVEIASLDMSSEYVMFFGLRYRSFKKPYVIKFDACDVHDNDLIRQADKIELWFGKADRKVRLVWCLDPYGNVIKRKMGHPNILLYDLK